MHGSRELHQRSVHLVDGSQANSHSADRAGTLSFHTRRDAALRAGACVGRAGTSGGEHQLNRKVPSEWGSLTFTRYSGAFHQLALFSDSGAAVLPGRDPQRIARTQDHSPLASGEWLLGAGALDRVASADTSG